MSSELSSSLVKPFLEISSYKELEIPFEYTQNSNPQIIKDFIHQQHPKLCQFKLINKQSTPISLPSSQTINLPHISSRKSYEINQFISYINKLHTYYEFEFIIDVGAGKPYLGYALSSTFKILSIEKDISRVKTSRKLGFLLSNDSIHHTDSLNFGQETLRFINSQKSINGKVPKALIVGLDTCGDLPNMIMDGMLRGVQGVDVIGCCFVSCCYHKVSELRSHALKNVNVNFCGIASSQDLRFLKENEVVLAFKKEYYEEKLHQFFDVQDLNVCKNDDYDSWGKFISRIESVYGIELVHLRDMVNNEDELQMFQKWCYTRGFLSQVLETIVHRDRINYLKENDVDVSMEILFDFTKSSRNVLITGIK